MSEPGNPLDSLPTDPEALGRKLRALAAAHWRWILAEGVIFVILGTAAILLPWAASVAVDLFLGALLVIGGAVSLGRVVRCSGLRGRLTSGILAAAMVALGAILIVFPLAGTKTLTLALAAFFAVEGVGRLVMAALTRGQLPLLWMVVGGVAGLVVAALILAHWPSSAVWALGLLVGINLIFFGWSMIFAAFSLRQEQP